MPNGKRTRGREVLDDGKVLALDALREEREAQEGCLSSIRGLHAFEKVLDYH